MLSLHDLVYAKDMLCGGHSRLPLALAVGAVVLILGCTPSQQQAPGTTAQQTAEQPKYGGTLTLLMNQAGDPPSFDLHQESTSAVTEAAGTVYDNLIMFDPLKPSEIVPDLAGRWELGSDGKSYTFHLHRGVNFQNGTPLTAADVKFTLERVMAPPKGMISPRRDSFGAISSIDLPDDHTVKINLKRPNPSLLANLAQGWMAIYSRKWVEEKGQDAPKKEMMGTGPYKLKEYLQGTSLEVERNPNYWVAGRPYLDGVKYFIVPDPATRFAALRTGRVLMSALVAADYKQLQDETGDQFNFQNQAALSFGALYLNTRRKPFDDPRVREAFNLAVDRYAGVQVLAQGDGSLGGYMLPGGPWSLPADEIQKLPGYARDKTTEIAQAKKLLTDAGFPNGFKTTITTRSGQFYVNLSVFVIDQLKKINVSADLATYETAQANDLTQKGNFDLLTWSHAFALDDPDAVYGEFYLCNAPRNWSRLCNPELDRLFEAQSQEVDPAKRKAQVLEMERKTIPSATKIITHWTNGHSASRKFVKGYVPHPSTYNNIRYRDVWLDR